MNGSPSFRVEGLMKRRSYRFYRLCLALCLLAGAACAATNDLSDAEIEGRDLVRQLLEQRPATNFTQTGLLSIRNGKVGRINVSVKIEAIVYPTRWRPVGFPTNWASI